MLRLEFKSALTVGDDGMIEATAWPFGSADRLGDVITRGAFKDAKAPLPMLAFHDPSAPIGVWDSVMENGAGLQVKGRLLVNDVPRARELHALVKAQAITGVSIGFRGLKSTPLTRGGRSFSEVDLMEISLVSLPAHPGARITAAKSIEQAEAFAIAAVLNRAAAALKRGV